MVIFKNTLKLEHPSLLSNLRCNNCVVDSDFVNTSFYFTKEKDRALIIKSGNLAYSFSNMIDGYMEEIEK